MANNGLGRGLGSLIPNKQSQKTISKSKGNDSIAMPEIEVDKIMSNPHQPRHEFKDSKLEELKESIIKHGILQPLVLLKKNNSYELIAGERRLRAAKLAGLKKVPIIIREANEQEQLELALIENVQREDLNPIDLADGYRQLIKEFKISQEEVARRVGKSRPSVTNTLRLLKLPEEIKLALIANKITEGHAKYLLGMEDENKRMNLFRKILHGGMSVDNTSKEARRMGGTKEARIKINYADKDKEFAFREFFGAKAQIKRRGRGGQVIIDFFSDDELAEMVGKIK